MSQWKSSCTVFHKLPGAYWSICQPTGTLRFDKNLPLLEQILRKTLAYINPSCCNCKWLVFTDSFRCIIYAQANVLARKFYLCNSTIKQLYLIHTEVQCIPQVFGVILKNSLKGITVAYDNSFRILHNLSPCCSASYMFATNYVKSFNFDLLSKSND